MLQIADIEAAASRLDGIAHKTPVFTSRQLNDLCGAEVYLKAENLQRGGAFKFRGAYNSVVQLSSEERAKGVTAASSGNHAQALALACRLLGVNAKIVMPSDSAKPKVAATREYGADIVFYDRYTEYREAIQDEIAEREGRIVIPPYDRLSIMAGAGTTALEMMKQVSPLDAFLTPVGGGGLVSGCAVAIKALSPATNVFGVEPEAGDDTRRSLAADKVVRIDVPKTIADGLQTPAPGELTFPVIQKLVREILVVTDAEIVQAMRFLLERMKILVEPSGAAALAGLIRNKAMFAGQKVGVVLSGGNVDLGLMCELLNRR